MIGSPLWSAWTTVGFWINGQRKEACKTQKSSLCNTTAVSFYRLILSFEMSSLQGFDFTDPLLSANPTGYIWGVGQPSGGGTFNSSCLHLSFNTSTRVTQSVDDYTWESLKHDLKWYLVQMWCEFFNYRKRRIRWIYLWCSSFITSTY